MAKISRKKQEIFGSTGGATAVGEYGSAAAGLPAYSTDLDNIQTARFLQGWLGAVLAGGKKLPAYEDFNAVQFVQTSQLAYLFQEGIPEYLATPEYHQNSIVKKVGTYELWGSVINANVGNPLVEGANWTLLHDLQAALTLPSNIKTDNYLLTTSDTDKMNMMNNAVAKAFTFPAVSEGAIYFIKNIGVGVLTLTPNGGDTIEKTTLDTDDSVILQGDATNTKWRIVSNYDSITSSQAANGYIEIPNGTSTKTLFQWGTSGAVAAGGGTTAVVFSIAFPNNVLNLSLTWATTPAPVPDNGIDAPQGESLILSGFTARNRDPDTVASMSWFAVGN